MDIMKDVFKGKKILVTGGAGSIGSAIAEELAGLKCEMIRILDINETALFNMQHELSEHKNIRYLVGDVRDKERMKMAVEDTDIVIHTAALKHVNSSEYNPFEAVKTNIVGMQNIIDVCMEEEIEKFIFTSSDKATSPTNVMGATKLLGERLTTAANYYKGKRKTRFSSVRFGNVIGSQGSAVPLFMRQIRKGVPVTITDGNMTRFVMSKKEAIQFIFKSISLMQGGEVFILKMPVFKVSDLYEVVAEKMREEYNLTSTQKTIGAHSGEKMHEELMTLEESRRALETSDMFILLPEMKELLGKNNYVFDGALRAPVTEYSSKNAKLLPKREIKELIKDIE